MQQHLAIWIATFFRVGNIPFAPGTFGSLIVLPIAYLLLSYTELLWVGLLALILFSIITGVWASSIYLRNSGKNDPGEIVIDEVAGQSIALLLILYYASQSRIIPRLMFEAGWPITLDQAIYALFLLAFLLFRLFDILKPGPVGWCDRQVKGAWGVMADDLVAGLLAGITGISLLMIITMGLF